jgi:hypothetical protein
MSAKNKILYITIIEKGRKKPINRIACLWNGSSVFNLRFYDDAYFHFSKSDILKALRNPKHFEDFTLLDAKVVGEWF